MTSEDDRFGWSRAWQRQPSLDVDRLRAQMRRLDAKRRMRRIIGWLAPAVSTAMLAALVFRAATPMSLRIWAMMIFVLLVVTLVFRQHAERGLWREAGENSMSAFLQRSARHARTSVRLAVAGVFCSSLIVLITLIALVLPHVLVNSQTQAASWQTPWGTAIVCVAVAGVGGVFHALRLHAQRQRLNGIRALLRENANDDSAS